MDEAKARFIFGTVPEGQDLDDLDTRSMLLHERFEDHLDSTLHEVVATQIANDDPPETWQTAQRLIGLGQSSEEAFGELTLALAYTVGQMLGEKVTFDHARFARLLDSLPTPSPGQLEETLVNLASRSPGQEAGELIKAALAELGRSPDDQYIEIRLVQTFDSLLSSGELVFVHLGQVAHSCDLTEGIVLTHRLTREELDQQRLDASFDLAGFEHREDLRLASGLGIQVDVTLMPEGRVWVGPDGWLAGYPVGGLVAVRVTRDGEVTHQQAADPPAAPGIAARVREHYDRECLEADLPLSGWDLILKLQFEDRATFQQARPPLTELCAAVGLEVRGREAAHQEAVWTHQDVRQTTHRVFDHLQDQEDRVAAGQATEALVDPDASDDKLRSALGDLGSATVLEAVAEEVFAGEHGLDPGDAGDLAGRVLAVARRPRQVAVARWIAALVSERAGEALAADRHVRAALLADPHWTPGLERAAWYASDKGDAATAVELWRRAGHDPPRVVEMVANYVTAPTGRLPGRNEPCWCGSGRKFKQCHLGRDEVPPPLLRAGWLYSKAMLYLEHQGDKAGLDLFEYARRRAVDPTDDDSLREAIAEHLVIDIALSEGGWFARFIRDRSPLLPEDEARLAQDWVLVRRAVYEVVEVAPGTGVVVRDLTTGDRIEVRDQSLSTQPAAGRLLCGRAMPDGTTHQFAPGQFPVAAGTELELAALCEAGDGFGICEFARRQSLRAGEVGPPRSGR